MGWNDRLLENPYEPYDSYTEQDHYESWMNYLNECRKDSGLSSQNIDPANVSSIKVGVLPLLRRLFASVTRKTSGQEIQENEQQVSRETDSEIPF